MGKLFSVKVRSVGTSLGVLIPKEIIVEENIKEGEHIEISIMKKNLRLLKEAFGSAKGAKLKFERNHRDRI